MPNSNLSYPFQTKIFQLSPDELSFCKTFAEIRTKLQKQGDPSLDYSTYPARRIKNNYIGQIAEQAVLKLLEQNNIPFSAICFTVTNMVERKGVLPPLADFIMVDGSTIDIKADSYDLYRYPPIIPNEKLNDVHIADYTIFVECRENSEVVLYGWVDRNYLLWLRTQPNAVRPNNSPMPKPCKRVNINDLHDINALTEQLKTNARDSNNIGENQLQPTVRPLNHLNDVHKFKEISDRLVSFLSENRGYSISLDIEPTILDNKRFSSIVVTCYSKQSTKQRVACSVIIRQNGISVKELLSAIIDSINGFIQ